MYPLYWTKPVEGVFLCVTAMNLKENVLNFISKVFGQKHQKELVCEDFATKLWTGRELRLHVDQKLCSIRIITKHGLQKNVTN